MRVLKWVIGIDDQQWRIGTGQVLHVGQQEQSRLADQLAGDRLMVWTLEDDVLDTITRYVQVFGTGHQVPDDAVHLGSVIAGSFVWHVFEVKKT